jgi:hypothetical protein
MENLPLTSHARHPLLFTMIPSLDFRQGAQIFFINPEDEFMNVQFWLSFPGLILDFFL